MYGSMSSLPSVSSIGSRHLYNNKDKRAREERKGRGAGKDKNYNKRFQRLESHVVTLARSVAHLSSEMRTQHVIVQVGTGNSLQSLLCPMKELINIWL